MPRRREVPERIIVPDAKYNSKLVSKFIKSIMRDGKKSIAESILYDAMDIIEKKTNEPPIKIFEQALDAFKRQSWNEAISGFNESLNMHPKDGPCLRLPIATDSRLAKSYTRCSRSGLLWAPRYWCSSRPRL